MKVFQGKFGRKILLAAASLTVFSIMPVAGRASAAMAQDGFTVPWAQPPAEFKDVQRKGFHAGVQAAIKDYDKHREPDLERHKEYVHPKVDRSYVPDYREGFKRGYDDALRHLTKTHGHAS
ncbi:MAG TPA: hypothetical protein VGL22_11925 [Terracidiphilus sp.]|jgi:hypothetical protein